LKLKRNWPKQKTRRKVLICVGRPQACDKLFWGGLLPNIPLDELWLQEQPSKEPHKKYHDMFIPLCKNVSPPPFLI